MKIIKTFIPETPEEMTIMIPVITFSHFYETYIAEKSHSVILFILLEVNMAIRMILRDNSDSDFEDSDIEDHLSEQSHQSDADAAQPQNNLDQVQAPILKKIVD